MSAQAVPALEVSRLSAGYGDIRVLWGISFSVRRGEISALLGRNGAGKTTTLSAIAGVLRASSGTVHVEGREVTRLSVQRRVRSGLALVQENKRVFKRRTVEQNLKIGGVWRYRDRGEYLNALEREFARFPILKEKRRMPASTLSGGEQQMLAISQALMSRPDVLMLDEPSAGLAPEIQRRLFKTITELKQEGLAILLVEQLVHQSLGIADWVGVLELGRLAMSKPASEVQDASEIQDVYMGTSRLDS